MKRITITTFVLLAISINSFGQFTRENAIDLVLDTVLADEIGEIDIYSSYNEYSYGDTIFLASFATYQVCPFNNNWVFFSDDLPFVGWHHGCRYIFVNSENGEYLIVEDDIYPQDIMAHFEPISFVEVSKPPQPDYAGQPFITTALPNDHLYAVLITETDTKEQWKDISAVYNTLINVYGYKKENIYVFYEDGTSDQDYGNDLDGFEPSNDIDFPANYNNIHETFQYMSGELTGNSEIPELQTNDQLFILTDGHGNGSNGNSYVYLNDGILNDTELASWVSEIKCSQMIFHIQQCRSGGFIDDLSGLSNVECVNREVHAACGSDENSVSEVWVTFEGSGQPHLSTVNFTEYLFYWNAAARGYFPDFDQPWLNIMEYTVGEFPLEDHVPGHSGNWDPDTNGDGIVTMGEAHIYASYMDTWSFNGIFIPFYPNEPDHHYTSPDPFYNIDFEEDLLTLQGLSGKIMHSQSINGNFVIGGPLTLSHNATLTIQPNSNLHFINDQVLIDGEEIDVNFTVPANHGLILQNDVSFHGHGNPNSIEVHGNIEIGQNNQFLSLSGNKWVGLNLLNNEANINISNAVFEKCGINGNPKYLNLDGLSFTDGYINLQTTNVDLENSGFSNSYFKDIYGDRTSFVNINNCNFDHSLTHGVYINTFYSYQIENCTINSCLDGIKIYNSGSSNTARIYQNSINNNLDDGIEIYNSHAYLRLNNVRNNIGDGISLHNNSLVNIRGNKGAHFVSETQRLRDNGAYEMFSDGGSFPELFRWNAIIDEDNDYYELVYCESEQSEVRDVRYNYWGSEETFDPNDDLYPSEDYSLLPMFKLEDDEDDSGIAEIMFYSAENDFELGNYSAAKNGYQQVIGQYPESKFAKASIKQLFSVEEYEANNYHALKQYYRTNSIILSNPDLESLADFFANKCDIKLENWQGAIDWFEYKIQNPESFADSLYAIIDLGNTYLLMEQSGYKSAYSGNMIEHIPVSTDQYNIKRDFLISLLPQDNLSKTMKDNLNRLNEGQLLQNVPNPFKGSTQIWYKLNTESTVKLNVYNYTGQLIRSIDEGTRTKGNHSIDFDATGLKNGIYFYSISINGKATDSKKMTIMK